MYLYVKYVSVHYKELNLMWTLASNNLSSYENNLSKPQIATGF